MRNDCPSNTATRAIQVWKLDRASGSHAPTLVFTHNFSLTGEMEISVHSASGLIFNRLGGGSSAFVEAKLGQTKVGTSVVKSTGSVATWDQVLDPIPISRSLESANLRIALYNHSKHLRHSKMGQCYIPLATLYNCMVTVKDSGSLDKPDDVLGSSKSGTRRELEPTQTNPIPYFIEFPFVVDLRSEPTTDQKCINGRSIAAGTNFWVVERLEKQDKGTLVNGGKNTFLRLADNAGWVFTTHQKDGRQIALPSMRRGRHETPKERKYGLIKRHSAWFELTNKTGKCAGRLRLGLKLFIRSEREMGQEEAKDLGSIRSRRRRKKKKRVKIFGGTLVSLAKVGLDMLGVPQCVISFVEFLYRNGLGVEGIFRVPGHHSEVETIQKSIEKGASVELKTVHDTAGALKKFFRELKEPIIPKTHSKSFTEVCALESKDSLAVKNDKFKFLMSTLSHPHRATLSYLLDFLLDVSAEAARNKMTVKNLAVVWAPNLFPSDCMQFLPMIACVEHLIRHCRAIFGLEVEKQGRGLSVSIGTKRKNTRFLILRFFILFFRHAQCLMRKCLLFSHLLTASLILAQRGGHRRTQSSRYATQTPQSRSFMERT